jgi:hypothetical protein
MRHSKLIAGCVLATLWAVSTGRAQSSSLPAVSPHDFAIMAWGFSPSDPAELQGMKEAGLNISGFCKVADLDRVAAAGLSCFVFDGRANNYNWEERVPEAKIRANLSSLASEVRNKPALLGVFLRDEPTAAMMPGLGEASATLRQVMPGAWPYVDLLPAYASPTQWGVSDYHDYIQKALGLIHPAFLSYDDYSLVNGRMLDRYYTTLALLRRASLQAHIPLWSCVLATAHYNYMEPSDATFNLQVYSVLAYGGRGIEYYKYFTPPSGNFRLGPVDPFGNRTSTWDMLRRINLQIQALAPTLIHLHSTGVYHGPSDVPPEGHSIAESPLVSRVDMTTPSIQPPVPPDYLVGEFRDDQGRSYLMIVNKDLTNSFACHLVLRQSGGKLFLVSPYTGKEEPARDPQWLAPGDGVLLRIQ